MHEKNRERTITPAQNGKGFSLALLRALVIRARYLGNQPQSQMGLHFVHIFTAFFCLHTSVDTADARQSECQDFNLEGSQFDLFKIFFSRNTYPS